MQTEFTEERALWLYQHYLWLEKNLPPKIEPEPARIVLATKDFFPDTYANDHASAECVFQRVRDLMGLSNWVCRLECGDDEGRAMQSDLRASGMLGQTSQSGAAGLFSASQEDGVVITYSSSLLQNPVGLVATFAHELCHYLLATVETEPPATWEALEPLTDLCAITEGFGVFLCNAAFQFTQWTSYDQQGWSWQRSGYLSEEEIAFALAVFCVRNKLDASIIAKSIKPNANEIFCDALGYVEALEENEGGK
ncbi:hypothetical protein M2103_000602 [Ereboglobus sp. PH5-5]|uniref:hypothetical protein n=1 Tax=Ereboglobus sp. PH5-5 TaxID=2940529 RepID=UPI0024052145|nr:hypothetical protein [Ereboglobus sp. PH5-5]MDF9832392.1 hypothetical protein [Ereboglobus sp. PH5-5]